MTLKTFRSYQLAIEFHQAATRFACPGYLRGQLLRASSSIVLNLAEGSGKESRADQGRFYRIALGSMRECQAILDLSEKSDSKHSGIASLADRLGAHIWRLCHQQPEAGSPKPGNGQPLPETETESGRPHNHLDSAKI